MEWISCAPSLVQCRAGSDVGRCGMQQRRTAFRRAVTSVHAPGTSYTRHTIATLLFRADRALAPPRPSDATPDFDGCWSVFFFH